MAKVITDESNYSAIASQIRSKLGVSTRYKPSEMAAAIGSISGVSSSDNGKVVVDGQLTQQTSRSVSRNGTYDTTTNNEVVVNVSGGGGSTNILTGTEVPISSQGSNGALYLQYNSISLPSGYTLLEYLESTGTQYIDTGVANSSTAYFEVECSYNGSGTPSGNNAIFGAAQSSGEFVINYWNVWFLSAGVSHLNINGQRHIYSAKSDGLYVDGVLGSRSVDWSKNTGMNYQMFAMNYAGTLYKSTNARIYSCKIYNGSTIVRHFVPAKDSNNVLGMYDLVNDVFYDNDGTGTFVDGPGASVNDPILAVYLKVNGSWVPIEGQDIDDVNIGS